MADIIYGLSLHPSICTPLLFFLVLGDQTQDAAQARQTLCLPATRPFPVLDWQNSRCLDMSISTTQEQPVGL